MEEVDAEGLGLWDYHQKIKEPMWLNKIIENFENNRYNRFAEFARDFRIMVENCYRYVSALNIVLSNLYNTE